MRAILDWGVVTGHTSLLFDLSRNTIGSREATTGTSCIGRKMKDHAFKSHLSHFFKLPVRVTGVDPVLFHQLDEALETVGRFGAKTVPEILSPRWNLYISTWP
jgi:hypothetical protein